MDLSCKIRVQTCASLKFGYLAERNSHADLDYFLSKHVFADIELLCWLEPDLMLSHVACFLCGQEWSYRIGSLIVAGFYMACSLTVFFGTKEKEGKKQKSVH